MGNTRKNKYYNYSPSHLSKCKHELLLLFDIIIVFNDNMTTLAEGGSSTSGVAVTIKVSVIFLHSPLTLLLLFLLIVSTWKEEEFVLPV